MAGQAQLQVGAIGHHERRSAVTTVSTLDPIRGLLHCERTGLRPLAEEPLRLGETALETPAHPG